MKHLPIALMTLFSTSAFALPINFINQASLEKGSVQNKNYNFEGIVKLSNCSGAIVRFHGQPKSAKAFVMTNGHCISKPGGGFLAPGETWSNRPISRDMKVFDKQMRLFPIKATSMAYATMTGTDLAFYELQETYEQIENNFKIRPLVLSSFRPLLNTSIEIISGYWDRGYSCAIDNFVYQIKEDAWTWTDSIRYTEGCNTIGGTSGSPIIKKNTRLVVGINNTSNTTGESCTMNNPCEVTESGRITAEEGVRYGQQTYQTYSCLTVDFKIDLTRPGCMLPK